MYVMKVIPDNTSILILLGQWQNKMCHLYEKTSNAKVSKNVKEQIGLFYCKQFYLKITIFLNVGVTNDFFPSWFIGKQTTIHRQKSNVVMLLIIFHFQRENVITLLSRTEFVWIWNSYVIFIAILYRFHLNLIHVTCYSRVMRFGTVSYLDDILKAILRRTNIKSK